MTTTTTAPDTPGEDFTTSEGLRSLLIRLHDAGPGSWEHDPVAAALMSYAAERYAPLAHKHRLDPWEAASAAFDVMRTRAARDADDPWAVITHAVKITCIAEERGQGLLCSVHQARRPHVSCFHDPERLSDRENTLDDYHPAFHVTDRHHDDSEPNHGPSPATSAVEDTILLFTLLGWPEGTARAAIEHVCESLARAGSRTAAYESLRRDRHARALLDVPAGSWTVLLRLLLGENLPTLLDDDGLVTTIHLAAPGHQTGYRGA